MSSLIVTVVNFDSPRYHATVALRDKILREPLGLSLPPHLMAAEAADHHVAGFEGEELVGCLMLVRKSDEVVQMRQVAVAKARQGQGVGRALVAFAEEFAAEQGFGTMMLHARETAVFFYLKLDYAITSEKFTVVTLPHYEMRKELGT